MVIMVGRCGYFKRLPFTKMCDIFWRTRRCPDVSSMLGLKISPFWKWHVYLSGSHWGDAGTHFHIMALGPTRESPLFLALHANSDIDVTRWIKTCVRWKTPRVPSAHILYHRAWHTKKASVTRWGSEYWQLEQAMFKKCFESNPLQHITNLHESPWAYWDIPGGFQDGRQLHILSGIFLVSHHKNCN